MEDEADDEGGGVYRAVVPVDDEDENQADPENEAADARARRRQRRAGIARAVARRDDDLVRES